MNRCEAKKVKCHEVDFFGEEGKKLSTVIAVYDRNFDINIGRTTLD